MRISNIAYGLIIFISTVFILYIGKALMIPFVLAIIIWFIIKEIRNWVGKIKFGKKSLPYWLLNIIAFSLIFGVLFLQTELLTINIKGLAKEIPVYQSSVQKLTVQMTEKLGDDIMNTIKEFFQGVELSSVFNQIFDSVSKLVGKAFLVLIYVLFLLLEESTSILKLKAMYPKSDGFHSAKVIIEKINATISRYIFLKTVVSFITAVASYIALVIIGVDFAFFWASLIFMLNYIPTVGSLIATVFPAMIAMLQFGDMTHGLMVLGVVGAIQTLVGNVIEPRLVGNSLDISPLVVLLSLSFWGFLWGIVGMLLCVPITVIMIIIFAQFDSTRNVAIILSGKGEVD